jgi:hypothetical protein
MEESLEVSTSILIFLQFLPVLFLVEVINDYTNEHIHDKEGSANHETDKVNDHVWLMVLNLNFVDTRSINACVHDSSPTLGGCQYEQSPHRLNDVVKVRETICPVEACIQAVFLCDDAWSC